jgi:transcriptional regulator with XRE-family HTH domain
MDASILYGEVGGLIRRRRRALDLTQAKLAARLGMSRGALANIETGRQNLFLHHLYRFASVLEMDVRDLLPPLGEEAPLAEAHQLPMPKGLTPEQETQIARVLSQPAQRKPAPAKGD